LDSLNVNVKPLSGIKTTLGGSLSKKTPNNLNMLKHIETYLYQKPL
jgi:hypothetical protein